MTSGLMATPGPLRRPVGQRGFDRDAPVQGAAGSQTRGAVILNPTAAPSAASMSSISA
jgi:hypothetical protein